jgi:sortase (surface protein transpeptidase)
LPKETKWVTLVAGIFIAICITAVIGIGMWLLFRFHRKKMLEGTEEDENAAKSKNRKLTAESAQEAAELAQEKLDKFNRKIM